MRLLVVLFCALASCAPGVGFTPRPLPDLVATGSPLAALDVKQLVLNPGESFARSSRQCSLAFESFEGRTAGTLRVEAGTAWSTVHGWRPEARADAILKIEATAHIGFRVVLFDRRDDRVNLHPLEMTK